MIKSINPATLELNGEVEETNLDKVDEIFRNSRKAQKIWAKLPLNMRIKKIVKVNEVISKNFDEISILISKEVGKPPSEALNSEIYGAMDSAYTYYNLAESVLGKLEEIPLGIYERLNKKSFLLYKPIGVICVIGPFNYPFAIPFHQIIQSLIAGNSVIFKPSSDTVLVGQKIQEIFNDLNIPQNLVQTIFGEGSKLGNSLIDNADKIIFTGSTSTGKKIMQRAAQTLTDVSLELGGKSAMIVFPDADIDRALLAARWGAFTNSGQVCASVKRLYVHSTIYDTFLDKLIKLTKELKQGIPTDPDVDIGAMVNEEQLKVVDKMVKTGLDEGAKLMTGGQRNPNFKGYFYEPTILVNVTNEMRVVQEEIFGPVLVVLKFSNNNEVIDMVNNSQYGLTSSVWTKDIKFGQKIAEEIDTGTVMINEVVYAFGLSSTPWGGTKYSGIGRTHGKFGFYEVVRPLHINIDRYNGPDPWWMPYNKSYQNILENFKIRTKNFIVKVLDD